MVLKITQTTPININQRASETFQSSVKLKSRNGWTGFIVDSSGDVIDSKLLKVGDEAYYAIYTTLYDNSNQELLFNTPIKGVVPLTVLKVTKVKSTFFSQAIKFTFGTMQLIGNALLDLKSKPRNTQIKSVCCWQVMGAVITPLSITTNFIIVTENVAIPTDNNTGFFEVTSSLSLFTS
jgi:hypothetical protein